MLLVAAVIGMLLGMRLRPLSLLRRTRFGTRLLCLLRARLLARCRLWARFLAWCLLGLLRMIFLTRLRLRLRTRLFARRLLGLLRVIFLTWQSLRLRLRAGLFTRSLLSHRRMKFRRARLLSRLRLLACRRCVRFPSGRFRRASSHRRIFARMRHAVLLLALLHGDGTRLLPVRRFALRCERLTARLLLRCAVRLRLLGLLCHRRMRLRPRGFVTTLGRGLLSRYRTA
jgi:hypothetical protein